MLETATAFTVPGKYLVEALPALQYLPQWFPGAAFKREAAVASIWKQGVICSQLGRLFGQTLVAVGQTPETQVR